jgi:hypothetical protein
VTRGWVLFCLGLALALVLPMLGVPAWLAVILSSPIGMRAGWMLAGPGLPYTCGWCGRSFGGAYDWCCPRCAEEVHP